MKDYKIAALAWGETLQLKPYVNEIQAVEAFKGNHCDAVVLTGTFSREFNQFTGSLDAVGALTTYAQLKTVINSISRQSAQHLLINGDYEVAGILPVGAAFLYVNDRALVVNEVDKKGDLSKVSVAIMHGDPVQAELIGFIGASYERSTLAEMYAKFNNNQVDATYGPAVVFEAMELYRGMKDSGGVIRFPLAQLTLQVILKRKRFVEGFAQHSREYLLNQFDFAVSQARNYENRIDANKWIEIQAEDRNRYHEIFRKTRDSLLAKGIYSDKMLKIMRIVRCRQSRACQSQKVYQ